MQGTVYFEPEPFFIAKLLIGRSHSNKISFLDSTIKIDRAIVGCFGNIFILNVF